MVECVGWFEVFFAAVWRCGVCWLLVFAFDFQVAMHGRNTPPPLSRGENWIVIFYLTIRCLCSFRFPSGEGIKGCVTVRCAG